MKNIRHQIKIAEAAGVIRPWTFGSFVSKSGCLISTLPDYFNDLNAMHHAEMTLSDTPKIKGEKSDRTRYREILCVVTMMNGGPIHATAEHRAEAFLKTINALE